jgi:ParB family chromosome partitioning protein
LVETSTVNALDEPNCEAYDQLLTIELKDLRTPDLQLRQIDEKIVEELVISIRRQGLLQPILVRPLASRGFEIVFGVHRVEAYRRLGRNAIPAMVRSLSDEGAFLARLGENLTRNVLIDPISEAKGYIFLIDKGWTINQIANQIGKSDSYVSDKVGLVRRLDPSIVSRVIHGSRKLTPTHAVLLARVKDRSRQLEFVEFIERKGLSVRELDKLIRNHVPILFQTALSRSPEQIALPARALHMLGITPGEKVHVRFRGRRIIMEPAST